MKVDGRTYIVPADAKTPPKEKEKEKKRENLLEGMARLSKGLRTFVERM